MTNIYKGAVPMITITMPTIEAQNCVQVLILIRLKFKQQALAVHRVVITFWDKGVGGHYLGLE